MHYCAHKQSRIWKRFLSLVLISNKTGGMMTIIEKSRRSHAEASISKILMLVKDCLKSFRMKKTKQALTNQKSSNNL